jgi:hypothetical protein
LSANAFATHGQAIRLQPGAVIDIEVGMPTRISCDGSPSDQQIIRFCKCVSVGAGWYELHAIFLRSDGTQTGDVKVGSWGLSTCEQNAKTHSLCAQAI